MVKQILVAENEEVWELQVRRRHPYPRPRTAMHASVQRYRGHPRLNPFVPPQPQPRFARPHSCGVAGMQPIMVVQRLPPAAPDAAP